MNYWIINKTQTQNNNFQDNQPNYNNFFSVMVETVKNKLPIGKKDSCIFFDMQEAKFQSYGEIINISKPTKIPHEQKTENIKPKYTYTISGEIKNKLTETNSIHDLSYSLLRINSYNKPQNHFKHQLTTVEKYDYETIVDGLIFISRTAFGKIANSLPRPYKFEFFQLAMQEFKTNQLKEIEYIKLLDFLYKYIEDRILSKGRLLIETDDLLRNKLADIVPYSKIGFYSEKNGEIIHDNIHEQAKIFRELFDIDVNNKIIKEIKKSIQENKEIEKRFNQKFKRKPFPLYLK